MSSAPPNSWVLTPNQYLSEDNLISIITIIIIMNLSHSLPEEALGAYKFGTHSGSKIK